jgi:hypothetical protein
MREPSLSCISNWNFRYYSPAEGNNSVLYEQLWKQYLGKGVKIPDMAIVKDFFRFHAALHKPRILAVPSVDSLNSNAERFFSSFERVTQTEISKDLRSKVYYVSILSI